MTADDRVALQQQLGRPPSCGPNGLIHGRRRSKGLADASQVRQPALGRTSRVHDAFEHANLATA